MNNAEFKFADNYTIVGSTCIIYKFTKEGALAENPAIGGLYNVSSFGVRYKKSSESEWQEIITNDLHSHTEYGQYMISSGDIETSGFENNLDFKNYIRNYPIYFVIFNLDANTEYDICGYYKYEQDEYMFNLCTAKTKSRVGTFNYIVTENHATDKELALQYLQQHMNIVLSMITPMIDFDMNFNVSIKKGYGAAAWDNGTMIMMPSKNPGFDVPIIIHELAHGYFDRTGPYLYESEDDPVNSSIIKYMEFCTHIPKALYNWMGLHVYPPISSAKFGDVENMFIISRFKLR